MRARSPSRIWTGGKTKQKRRYEGSQRAGRGALNLQDAVGPALNQVAAGRELERAPVAAVLPKADG